MNPPNSNYAQPPYIQAPATGFPMNTGHHHHNQPIANQEWSTGLFDCFSDCKTCCISYWCPCITFGRIAEIVDQGSTSCGLSGAVYSLICFFTGFGWVYSCMYRNKMRNQYMLSDTPCCDCLVHCCCESCALTQEYRELQNRGFNMELGWNIGNVAQESRGVAMAPTPPPVVHMSR